MTKSKVVLVPFPFDDLSINKVRPAMKFIQIKVDEELLAAIAKDKDFRAMEVSEFFRRAAKFFLKCKIEYEIDAQYERAYSDPRVREEFDREIKEWIDEQVWPD